MVRWTITLRRHPRRPHRPLSFRHQAHRALALGPARRHHGHAHLVPRHSRLRLVRQPPRRLFQNLRIVCGRHRHPGLALHHLVQRAGRRGAERASLLGSPESNDGADLSAGLCQSLRLMDLPSRRCFAATRPAPKKLAANSSRAARTISRLRAAPGVLLLPNSRSRWSEGKVQASLRHVSLSTMLGLAALLLAGSLSAGGATDEAKPGEPTDPKARKTFAEAVDWQKHGDLASALDKYRKANQQDGGHCVLCLNRAYSLAQKMNDYKTQESILRDWLPLAQTDAARATLHFNLAVALQREGISEKGEKKDTCLSQSCSEFKTALELDPKFTEAHYSLGVSLAYLHQDDSRARGVHHVSQSGHERAGPPRARRALCGACGAGALPHGPCLCIDHARRPADHHGRPARQGCAHRFLGHMVRAVPRGLAAHPRYRAQVCRATAGRAQRKHGRRRRQMERFRQQERNDLAAVSRRKIHRAHGNAVRSDCDSVHVFHRCRWRARRSARRRLRASKAN